MASFAENMAEIEKRVKLKSNKIFIGSLELYIV